MDEDKFFVLLTWYLVTMFSVYLYVTPPSVSLSPRPPLPHIVSLRVLTEGEVWGSFRKKVDKGSGVRLVLSSLPT